MKIKQIHLKNYRNYETCHVEFSDFLNLIIGDNGQGKTNLLESIYVCGFGKSFRTSKDTEWMKLNAQSTAISIEYEKRGHISTIEIRQLSSRKKEIKINGVPISKMSELIGHINLVLFSPEDLKLVKESPGERRKFIDREMSHISPAYYHLLISYNRTLDQRNSYLKQMQFKKTFDLQYMEIWDEKLSDLGAHITLKRIEFIKKLAQMSTHIHSQVTNHTEILEVKYISSLTSKNDLEYDTIYKEFLMILRANHKRDIERGYTTQGPHRDDLGLSVNGIDLRSFGSQGQQRTAALSLKLSEIEIIYNEIGEYPILLLDDVMSELDSHRQNFLIKTFDKVQTIVTSTEIGQLYQNHLERGKLFRISNGNVL